MATIRAIAQVGAPVLRQQAREVSSEELASPAFQTFIDELVATIDRLLVEMNREIRAELPYSEGALLNDIHELGAMLHEEFTPSGTLVHARVPPSLYGRLQPYEVSSTAR